MQLSIHITGAVSMPHTHSQCWLVPCTNQRILIHSGTELWISNWHGLSITCMTDTYLQKQMKLRTIVTISDNYATYSISMKIQFSVCSNDAHPV